MCKRRYVTGSGSDLVAPEAVTLKATRSRRRSLYGAAFLNTQEERMTRELYPAFISLLICFYLAAAANSKGSAV